LADRRTSPSLAVCDGARGQNRQKPVAEATRIAAGL
jgi:hypothetical protein